MVKPGHIRIGIDKKFYFEYYLKRMVFPSSIERVKRHEASKRLIKIENDCFNVGDWIIDIVINEVNNRPCEAEVTGDKATIIKLT